MTLLLFNSFRMMCITFILPSLTLQGSPQTERCRCTACCRATDNLHNIKDLLFLQLLYNACLYLMLLFNFK